MERNRLGAPLEALTDKSSLEDVFNYFVSEIVARLSVSAQDTLLKLAVLPYLTPELAVRASGDEHARDLIDYLYRHNLFLERRAPALPKRRRVL
jgi:ATP/maltotriose-dependent transcriptional regulator MalT